MQNLGLSSQFAFIRTCLAGATLALLGSDVRAQPVFEVGKPARVGATIDVVTLHPPFREVYYCGEHTVSDFLGLGDAFGKDCLTARPLAGVGPDAPFVFYRGEGTKNEDWFTWNATVLAPFDGVVEYTYQNTKTNTLGTRGDGPPSMILFVGKDGVRTLYVHLNTISVDSGQHVTRGSPVGTVGNNGLSRNPHVHIGAWSGQIPLQIQFDLTVRREKAP